MWKFFSTCGVETWDRDLGELVGDKCNSSMVVYLSQVGHYKNWREWAHTVHNLDKGEGGRRGGGKIMPEIRGEKIKCSLSILLSQVGEEVKWKQQHINASTISTTCSCSCCTIQCSSSSNCTSKSTRFRHLLLKIGKLPSYINKRAFLPLHIITILL